MDRLGVETDGGLGEGEHEGRSRSDIDTVQDVTRPSPSGKHSETSCMAGVKDNGELIRLYPVPFRLIQNE